MVCWPMWTSPPVHLCLSPIPSLSSRWYWVCSMWNCETENVTFQNPNVGAGPIQGVLNAAYPGYPSYSQPQSMTASYPQPQQQLMGYPAQNIHHINQTQPVYNQFQQQAQPVSHPQQVKRGLYKLLSLSSSFHYPHHQAQAVSLPASGQTQSGNRPIRSLNFLTIDQ